MNAAPEIRPGRVAPASDDMAADAAAYVPLSPEGQDALAELINIGFGRTADSLSRLTGERVSLDPPRVAILSVDAIGQVLVDYAGAGSTLASVHQTFTGPIDGDAYLVLTHPGAVLLTALLDPAQDPDTGRLDASSREALTEVGNILLNACLGMFANLLEVRFTFAVPRLRIDSLGDLVAHLVLAEEADRPVRHAFVVHTGFRLRERAVQGYLITVLGVASVERLLAEVDRWMNRAAGGLSS